MRTGRIASTMLAVLASVAAGPSAAAAADSERVDPFRMTGEAINLDAHQNAEFTPQGINTLTGQGPNVRAAGHGLLYQDVGRLVFDDSMPFPGESLFASAP